MRVALLSTYDLTTGAGRSAYRLLEGLAGTTTDARMVVQHSSGGVVSVFEVTWFWGELAAGNGRSRGRGHGHGYGRRSD